MTVEPIPYAAPLTYRQETVLAALIDGLSNREIAERLGTTCNYVRWVTKNIFNRTGTNSRHELVAYAFRAGLVKVEGKS